MQWLEIVLLICVAMFRPSAHAAKPEAPPPAPAVDFAKDVQPIFEKRCQPCHFPGGVMHEKLPFDRGETIAKLGTKVFSRIKDEDERAKIRKFLDAQPRG